MAKVVRTIPATIDRFSAIPIDNPRNKRVAAYARVSTDMEEQVSSYEAQVDYYTKYIKGHEGWDFVKVYTDSGITGTSTRHREGFNEMVHDALNGKIDLIISKSVSRFARNTVDSLTTIDKLREHNVECYFEKENIYTFDRKGELLLTFMSGLAQEESRSISENTTWGKRKQFADGKVSVAYSRFLGYDKGEDGSFKINEEQAVIVRRIYGMFLQGYSYTQIANKLMQDGVLTVTGKKQWDGSGIKRILQNEKYKGDALLQKGYTADFLTKKFKKNNGEVPQYYVKDNHKAIISPEIFDMVQTIIESRQLSNTRQIGNNVFSGRIFCGDCGSAFGSKVWHSNDKYRRVIWQCNNKFKNKKKCTTPHFTEKELQTLFVSAVNKLLPQKAQLKADFELIKDSLFNTDELQTEFNGLQKKLRETADLLDACIERNAREALDQNEFNAEHEELTERYLDIQERMNTVSDEINKKRLSKKRISDFLKTLYRQENLLTEFDGELFGILVDRVTVYSKEDVRFTFINGMEI